MKDDSKKVLHTNLMMDHTREPCSSTQPRAPIQHQTLDKCQGLLPQDASASCCFNPKQQAEQCLKESMPVLSVGTIMAEVNTYANPSVLIHLVPLLCFEPIARFAAPLSLVARSPVTVTRGDIHGRSWSRFNVVSTQGRRAMFQIS